MANEFTWIYILIFLAIPLARILPKVIRKIKGGQLMSGEFSGNFGQRQDQMSAQSEMAESARPQSDKMNVLGQMIAGAKTFESIQKYTQIDAQKLDSILQDLEAQEMISIEHKQGILGSKIQIHPTSKGLREFHN